MEIRCGGDTLHFGSQGGSIKCSVQGRGHLILFFLWITTGLAGAQTTPTQYTTDGAPTALEEEIRWLHNRARFDTAAENALRKTTYNDVPAYAGPLAPHQSITAAARNHSVDMATLNVFQHGTIPGSAFYNAATQPQAENRMLAEGYPYSTAGENISAGYATAAEAYLAWWKSTGHRVNITYTQDREIGCGYAFNSGSYYQRYYTANYGASGTSHFFTDTLFQDVNANGKYDQTEGRGSLEVTLRVSGAPHSHYDVSAAAGSFAIPINSIATGASVEVTVRNSSASAVQITIPRNYHILAAFTLQPGQTIAVGTFTKAAGTENIGFRNLVPALAPVVVAPSVAITLVGTDVHLTWMSQSGLSYMPQYSTSNLYQWNNGPPNNLAGTGAQMTWTQAVNLPGVPVRFYRLAVTATP